MVSSLSKQLRKRARTTALASWRNVQEDRVQDVGVGFGIACVVGFGIVLMFPSEA